MRRAFLLPVLLLAAACGGGSSEAVPPASEADVRPPPAEEPAEKPAPPPAEEKAAAEPTPKAPVEKEQADEKNPPSAGDVPGANLTIGSMTTDGLTARDIACRTEGGGMSLLGSVLVTAWMAPRKAQLDACAKPGTETRVAWKARGGKLLSVSASGDGKVKACVEKALAGGQPMLEGQCAATVVLGGS
jgi:hypothetical protein